MILRAAWSCFDNIEQIFCIKMQQCTKFRSTTLLQCQIGSKLSKEQPANLALTDQKSNSHHGMGKEFCSAPRLKKAVNTDGSIAPRCIWIKNKRNYKVLFHQDTAPCNSSIKTIAIIHELLYSPDLASRYIYLLADLNRVPTGKRCGSNAQVIAKREAYFTITDKSLYKNRIEKLEKHWNNGFAFKGTVLLNKIEFCQKVVVSLVILFNWCVNYLKWSPIKRPNACRISTLRIVTEEELHLTDVSKKL